MMGPWVNSGQRRSAVFLQRIRTQQPTKKRSALASSKTDVGNPVNLLNGSAALQNISTSAEARHSQTLQRLGRLWDSSDSWDHRSSPSSESRQLEVMELGSFEDSYQRRISVSGKRGGRHMMATSSSTGLFVMRESCSYPFLPKLQYGQSRHYATKAASKPAVDSNVNRVTFDWAPVDHLPLMPQHVGSDKDAKIIVALWKEKRQNRQTYEKKLKMMRFLQTRMFQKYRLAMTGSSANGFGFDNSDIDINVEFKNNMLPLMGSSAMKILSTMQSRMYGSEHFSKPIIIRAICPILKFSYKASAKQLPMQVDINASGDVGILNTQLLYSYSRMDPRVAPLVGACKQWASTMQVKDARKGLLSSYSLTLMVIHFLQTVNVLPVLHNLVPEFETGRGFGREQKLLLPQWSSSNSQDIGSLFRNMLKFYGDFDFRKYCIAVRHGKAVEIEQAIESDPDMQYSSNRSSRDTWRFINIQEPFNLTNTARSVAQKSSFDEVKWALQRSNQLLQRTGDICELLGHRIGPQNEWRKKNTERKKVASFSSE